MNRRSPATTAAVVLMALWLSACGAATGGASMTTPPATDTSIESGASNGGSAYADDLGAADHDPASRGGRRNRRGSDPATGPLPTDAQTGTTLTEAEIDGLVLMREEEKLARDVYLALFDRWGLPVFENIASSESRHTEAVRGLIEEYGLDDPVVDETPGIFSSPDLAGLYDTLVAQGSISLIDALQVGTLIEDLDIYDLRGLLAATGNPDIERVYSNLLQGSENHMRAFSRQLDRQGAAYEATYLSQAEIDEILADSPRRGRNG